jgi:hypothetical protein
MSIHSSHTAAASSNPTQFQDDPRLWKRSEKERKIKNRGDDKTPPKSSDKRSISIAILLLTTKEFAICSVQGNVLGPRVATGRSIFMYKLLRRIAEDPRNGEIIIKKTKM